MKGTLFWRTVSYRIALLFGKIQGATERRYMRRKYGKKAPQIYYDRGKDTFVSPVLLREQGEWGGIGYICGELVRGGLIYHYCLNGERDHEHSIDGVLEAAYNEAERFSIPPEFETEYSDQELLFIHQTVERARKDRQTS